MSKFVKLNYRYVTWSQKYQTFIVKKIIESMEKEKKNNSERYYDRAYIDVIQDRHRYNIRECIREHELICFW